MDVQAHHNNFVYVVSLEMGNQLKVSPNELLIGIKIHSECDKGIQVDWYVVGKDSFS